MLIIMITGTVLIMLNLPLIIVILGTLLGGGLGLLITGSISLKQKKEKPPKEKKEKKEKENKALFSGFRGAIKRDKEGLTSGSKEEEIKKIDDMLADAIEGEGAAEITEPVDGIATATPAEVDEFVKPMETEEENEEEDFLLTLSEEDFGDDIFDEIKVGEDDELPELEEEGLDKQLLIGGAESVDDILAAHASELEEGDEEELPDITGEGEGEPVSSLDALNLDEEALLAASLDELDLEEDEEPVEEYEAEEEFEEVPEEDEPAEEMEEDVSGDLEMISFASGVEDDDMISELKSQKKKKKQEVDLSLVRELRDVKIEVAELEEEMGEVLEFLNKEKEES